VRAGWDIPAGLAAGVALGQGLFISRWIVWPFLFSQLLCFVFFRKRWLAASFLALTWATHCMQVSLADRLDASLSGSILSVEGRIADLPETHDDFTRFRFEPASGSSPVQLPRTLLAYWYRDAPVLRSGETWLLELQVKPPWGQVNFHGMDRERWLFAEKIGGLATVRSGERLRAARGRLDDWNFFRHQIREQLAQSIDDEHDRAIVAALAIADRSGLSPWQRNVLGRTGTAHLLAISGLHVGLAAMFGFWISRCLMIMLPLRWTRGLGYPASLVVGLALASCYAALAGFGTSTIRALLMLAIGVLALLFRRTVHPGQAFLTALAAIVLFDPLAFLSAGFWLSFSAVGVLLLMFSKGISNRQVWWRQMIRAQAGIMLVLLPMGAWWFQSVSVIGLVANLLAIPFLSMVVVPLILLGLIGLPVSAALSAMAFSAAAVSVGWLFKLLASMAKLPFSSLGLQQPGLWELLLATFGALVLLLLQGLPQRWLGVLLMLPLFATIPAPPPGQMQIDVLDVGQGTSVLVNSTRHLLLYDSGPGNGKGFDLVEAVIRPAILRSGHSSPDTIIFSHADLDHAGGLQSLKRLYPAATVFGSFPAMPAGVKPCDDALRWHWDGLFFEVLHPSLWLPYLGNDSSCVVGVGMGGFTILLPGDISAAAEQRLLLQGRLRKVDVLLVPHHGSRSSSTSQFLSAVQPGIAIATAAPGNRFGFPLPEIQRRYRDAGIAFLSTDACGAVRITALESGKIQVSSARRSRPAPWRWPAADFCP